MLPVPIPLALLLEPWHRRKLSQLLALLRILLLIAVILVLSFALLLVVPLVLLSVLVATDIKGCLSDGLLVSCLRSKASTTKLFWFARSLVSEASPAPIQAQLLAPKRCVMWFSPIQVFSTNDILVPAAAVGFLIKTRVKKSFSLWLLVIHAAEALSEMSSVIPVDLTVPVH